MTDQSEDDVYESLAEHRLGRTGVQVKLDRGFEPGVYCVHIEYQELADRVGFGAARRRALDYATYLQGQMGNMAGYALELIDDPSHSDDPRRKRDLENTFLSFAVTANDGRRHDDDLKSRFRLALLRADQEWDQRQAHREQQRRDGRRERFRQSLDALLGSDAYQHVDAATKERLLAEVTGLVFPPRGREL